MPTAPKIYDLSIADDSEIDDPLSVDVSNVEMRWNGVTLAFSG